MGNMTAEMWAALVVTVGAIMGIMRVWRPFRRMISVVDMLHGRPERYPGDAEAKPGLIESIDKIHHKLVDMQERIDDIETRLHERVDSIEDRLHTVELYIDEQEETNETTGQARHIWAVRRSDTNGSDIHGNVGYGGTGMDESR